MSYNFCHSQHDKIKVISYFDFENILECSSYGCRDCKQAAAVRESTSWNWPSTYYLDGHHQQKLLINTENLVSFLRSGIEVLKTGKKNKELPKRFYTKLKNPSKIRQEIIQLADDFIQVCEGAANSLEVNYIRVGSESMDREIPLALCVWNENTKSEYFMRIRSFGWRVIELLATSNGWVPQGTKAPDSSIWFKKLAKLSLESGKKWDGNYYWKGFWQTVCKEDAQNLAHALRQAIEDITSGLRNQDLIEARKCDEDLVERIKVEEGTSAPIIRDAAEFRRETIELCEHFISFCNGAPFLIS